MDVSYKKLWKILIDKDMKKKDLPALANISNSTVMKMSRGENVNMDILVRICRALNCTFDDIVEILPQKSEFPDKSTSKGV